MIISLLLLTLVGVSCAPLRTKTYLIPAKIESRWITIEYSNPECEPLKESTFGRELNIPDTGYLCTSTAMDTEWHREIFYLIDDHNNRTEIRPEDRVFRRESFNVNQSTCKVVGEEFFYGQKEMLTYENPILSDENFLKLHPKCKHHISNDSR
jgi:Family of unknown function (DUF6843)